MKATDNDVGNTDQKVPPWGGIALMKQFTDTQGLFPAMSQWHFPRPQSNRAYNPEQLIEQMLAAVWSGAGRYSQLDISRLAEGGKTQGCNPLPFEI